MRFFLFGLSILMILVPPTFYRFGWSKGQEKFIDLIGYIGVLILLCIVFNLWQIGKRRF